MIHEVRSKCTQRLLCPGPWPSFVQIGRTNAKFADVMLLIRLIRLLD